MSLHSALSATASGGMAHCPAAMRRAKSRSAVSKGYRPNSRVYRMMPQDLRRYGISGARPGQAPPMPCLVAWEPLQLRGGVHAQQESTCVYTSAGC